MAKKKTDVKKLKVKSSQDIKGGALAGGKTACDLVGSKVACDLVGTKKTRACW